MRTGHTRAMAMQTGLLHGAIGRLSQSLVLRSGLMMEDDQHVHGEDETIIILTKGILMKYANDLIMDKDKVTIKVDWDFLDFLNKLMDKIQCLQPR